MDLPIIQRLLPVPPGSGFYQEGFFVWCGSVIQAGGEYHLFASRWPESKGFPEGYREHSEIVRATAASPTGPYTFREVVLRGRGGDYWDGKMCHNPKIVKIGSVYVLYYIGSACGSPLRKVGYAQALSVNGPWTRVDKPLPLGEDANNPAPYVHGDGAVLLAFRDERLRMHVTRAAAFDGAYQVVAGDIFPQGPLEDPDLSFWQGCYHMVVEDNGGGLTGEVRCGGHLVSPDGLSWRPAEVPLVYTHRIDFTDGTAITADRRERPALFYDVTENRGCGDPTHLVTAVWSRGRASCIVQPIATQPSAG